MPAPSARSLRYGAFAALRNLAIAAALLLAAPVAADPARLVAFGDSLTHGYGLPPEEGLVPQLQRWLDAAGAEVAVVNAGVSGDTTAGGRARLGWALSEGADAMILALGGNDMLRGLPPEEARANIAAMLEEARAQGIPVLLVGVSAPGNFGPDYKAAFDAIWPELAADYGIAHLPDLLAPILAEPDRSRALKELMQPDGIHPSAAGVALIVEALGPEVLRLLEAE